MRWQRAWAWLTGQRGMPYWLHRIPASDNLPLGAYRCRRCGLVCSTVKSARLHRPGRRCLDLATLRPNGWQPLMSIVYRGGDGALVWGWPRGTKENLT